MDPDTARYRRRQLALSAAFVLGCAFRSALPRADVQRICLVDSWLSSVLVGRSVATVAELAFVAQWALLLRALAEEAGAGAVRAISRAIVPLIAVAETCSWSAVLTTCYLGNVLEESIWALSASLFVAGLLALRPRAPAGRRAFLAAAIAVGLGYVAFMCAVDVPMYVSRWRADEAAGRRYLSALDGARDLARRWIVTGEWDAWREEMPWMSLYFSAAVWMSIGLVRAPRLGAVDG
jgi:hypothetical protein